MVANTTAAHSDLQLKGLACHVSTSGLVACRLPKVNAMVALALPCCNCLLLMLSSEGGGTAAVCDTGGRGQLSEVTDRPPPLLILSDEVLLLVLGLLSAVSCVSSRACLSTGMTAKDAAQQAAGRRSGLGRHSTRKQKLWLDAAGAVGASPQHALTQRGGAPG